MKKLIALFSALLLTFSSFALESPEQIFKDVEKSIQSSEKILKLESQLNKAAMKGLQQSELNNLKHLKLKLKKRSKTEITTLLIAAGVTAAGAVVIAKNIVKTPRGLAFPMDKGLHVLLASYGIGFSSLAALINGPALSRLTKTANKVDAQIEKLEKAIAKI